MSECDVVRERMPLLLIEAVEGSQREGSHLHIEQCAACEREFAEVRETWRLLGEVGELPVPPALRARFLDSIGQLPASNVVPFRSRPAARWIAQAAAVAVLIGGSFFAGRSLSPASDPVIATPMASAPFQISGSRIIPASSLDPDIQGAPRIENVRFVPGASTQDTQLAFDLTSEVTVTGRPGDPGLANLLAYVLKDQENPSHSRSTTIQWIRDNWSGSTQASPQLAQALTSVLQNDTHEGVRLKAIDALGSLSLDSSTSATQSALIFALKNDPNPAVRLKAVEALATITRSGSALDPTMLDTLRLKAEQDDENLYVRLKAAEALSQIDL